MLQALIFVVFPFCMVFAAISDMLSMTIANRVSIILVVTFASWRRSPAWNGRPMDGISRPAGLALSITFGLFALGGMGGGDAKLHRRELAVDGLQFQSALLSDRLDHDRRRADAGSFCHIADRRSPIYRQESCSCAISRITRQGSPTAWRLDSAGSSPIRTRRWLSGRSHLSRHTRLTATCRLSALSRPRDCRALSP